MLVDGACQAAAASWHHIALVLLGVSTRGPARLPRVGGARTPSALSPAVVMVRRAV